MTTEASPGRQNPNWIGWNWADPNFYMKHYETDLVNLFHKRNSTKAAWQISKSRTPGSRLQKAVMDQNRRDGAGDDMEATL